MKIRNNRKLSLCVILTLITANVLILAFNWRRGLSLNQVPGTEIITKDFSNNVRLATSGNFILSSGDEHIEPGQDIVKNWQMEIKRSFGKTQLVPNQTAILSYLTELSEKINKKPINAKFDIKNGIINETAPAKNGRFLDLNKTTEQIAHVIRAGSNEASLSFSEITPNITLEKLNILGITKLIGRGESDFTGSSAARIHNITTAVKIYDGVLVEPGVEFSFNELLGEVDASTGYKAELVIKGDKLIPEYGGGVCQVSTTIFRSAINAGLPITERKSHSLPVRYYTPQGFDATIYPEVVDLKFKNDTGNYILVEAGITGTKLLFELYSSGDGRKTVVSPPSYYDITPEGALKAVFSRTVTYADGEEKTEKFYSSYKAPSEFETLRNPLE
ncbi:MAG: VanW family protein [bacterium]|nr:VanW family protein [bacterium]